MILKIASKIEVVEIDNFPSNLISIDQLHRKINGVLSFSVVNRSISFLFFVNRNSTSLKCLTQLQEKQ